MASETQKTQTASSGKVSRLRSVGNLPALYQKTLVRNRQLERSFGMAHRIGQSFREWGYGLDLYNWRLTGRHPLKVDRVIDDIRPCDTKAGDQLIAAILDGKDQAQAAARYWTGKLDGLEPDHSFGFLTPLSAAREQLAARAVATALTETWCDKNLTWQQDVWSAPMCARRLVNWLSNIPMVLASSDLVYRSRVLLAVARQMRHLPRVVGDISRLTDRAAAGAALTLAGLILPDTAVQRDRGFRLLSEAVDASIQADGTPANQSIPDLLDIVYLCGLVKKAAEKAQTAVPQKVQSALDRAGPFIRALYHNGEAPVRLMGGMPLPRHTAIELLNQVGATGAAGTSFPYGGFYRMSASGTVVVLNTSPARFGPGSKFGSAETGALEVSSSGDLLISAMGASNLEPFKHVERATAARSALVLDNRHVTEIQANGELGAGVEKTSVKRKAHRDGEEIILSHDGYTKRLGYSHERQVHLSRDGLVLSGQDILTPTRPKTAECRVDIWFHLAPRAKARLTKDGEVVLLTPTKKIWVLAAKGAELSLEQSVYFADSETPLPSVAIRATTTLKAARAKAGPKVSLSWSLTRRE